MANEHLELTANTTSLVSGIDKATTAFINFDRATASVTKETATFNKAGDLVARTLQVIDAAGNKITTTFKNFEGDLVQVSTATRAAVVNLKNLSGQLERSAAAQKLLAQATSINITGLRKEAVAFKEEAALARASSIALQDAAAAHEKKATSAKSASGASSARRAASRKLTAALAAETLANEADAIAADASAAANLAAARATGLRNAAKATVAGENDSAFARNARIRAIKAQGEADLERQKQARLEARKTADVETALLVKVNARRKGITADRIKEAELILAETKRLETSFERAFQQNLKVAKAQAQVKQNLVLSVAQARKQVGIFAEALVLAQSLEAVRARANAIPLARGAAAQDGNQGSRIRALRAQGQADLKQQKAARLAEQELTAEKFANIQKLRKERLLAIREEKAANLSAAQAEFAERFRLGEQLRARVLVAIAAEKAARLTAANQIQADGLITRRKKTDFRTVGEGGKASEASVRGFLREEIAVKKLVATGTVGFKEMQTAIAGAQGSMLKLAQHTTIAQQAALKLIAAEDQVARGAQKAAVAANGLSKAIGGLGRLIGISLLIGGAFRLVTMLTDATQAAGELSIKIAELETITKTAAFTTEQWADGLRVLSSEFGLEALDQAEAAYQVLSNQIRNAAGEVINGAEALKFLDAANKLAVTGVTDTTNATNLLTAALNSFRLPAEDAEIVSAKLFKTVELGRLRIEELSQSFGRVAVPAKLLGINLDSLLGALAQTTIQGVKFNEASTLIRNVILKLIRPTDQMKKIFSQLGVSTGEALIQSRGFVGALGAIEQAAGGTTTELGKAFGRVRAITGALIFSGEGAEEAAAKIKEIGDVTLAAFGKDTQRVIESTGQQLKIAAQEAKNFFEEFVGTPVLQSIAKWIKEAGGMTKIIKGILADLKSVAEISALAFGALQLARLAKYTAGLSFAASTAKILKAEMVATRLAALKLNVALLATPAGAILAVTVAVTALTEAIKRAAAARLAQVEAENLAILDANNKLTDRLKTAEDARTVQQQRAIDKRVQIAARAASDIAAIENKRLEQLASGAKAASKLLKLVIAETKRTVSKQLTDATKQLKAFEQTATKAAKLIGSILSAEGKNQLTLDLDVAGVGQRIKILEQEIITSRARVAKATQAGDLKTFELERTRLNELVKARIDASIELSKESQKINFKLSEARRAQIKLTGRFARKQHDERIAEAKRLAEILKKGTSSQFDQEVKLQELREKVRLAATPEEFQTAIDQLQRLEREQQSINLAAREQRTIQAETIEAAATQAIQAAAIAALAAKRAKIARAEETRIKSLKFLFSLLVKESEAFDESRITAGKTEEEITKAFTEQQKRLAKLVATSRQIGGGAETDAVFIRQDEVLREKAAARQREIQEAAHQKDLQLVKDLLNEKLAALRAEQQLKLRNLKGIQSRINAFSAAIGGVDTADQQVAFNRLVPGISIPGIPGAKENTAQNTAIDFKNFQGLVKNLNTLIEAQRSDPTPERSQQISRNARELAKTFKEELARGSTNSLSTNPAAAGLREATKGFLITLTTIAKGLSELNQVQVAAGKINAKVLAVNSKAVAEETEQRDAAAAAAVAAGSATDQANAAIIEFGKVLNAVNTGGSSLPPGLTPGSTDSSATQESSQAGAPSLFGFLTDGFTTGIESASSAILNSAKEAGKVQANAYNDAMQKFEERLSKLRGDLQKRQEEAAERRKLAKAEATAAALRPPKRRKVDGTIRFGRGQPSIKSQQDRIRADVIKADAEFRAAKKKQREAQKVQNQARTNARGSVRVNSAGQLVSVRTGNEGHSETGVDAQGNLVVRSITTGTNATVDAINRTNALLAGETPGGQDPLGRVQGASGTGSGLEAHDVAELLTRGQATADAELVKARASFKVSDRAFPPAEQFGSAPVDRVTQALRARGQFQPQSPQPFGPLKPGSAASGIQEPASQHITIEVTNAIDGQKLGAAFAPIITGILERRSRTGQTKPIVIRSR